MKRDWSLVKEILEKLESSRGDDDIVGWNRVKQGHEGNFDEHIRLLHEGGFIEACFTSPPVRDSAFAKRMTWRGQELLQQLRVADAKRAVMDAEYPWIGSASSTVSHAQPTRNQSVRG